VSLSAQSGNGAIITPMRRFPPPWSIEEHNNACFIVKDAAGQALAYFYFEKEPGRRSAAKLLTRDDAHSCRWVAPQFEIPSTCTLTNAVFRQRVRDPTAANGSAQLAQTD